MTVGHDAAVAVMGIALRVPGSGDPDAFWEALTAGRVALPGIPGPGAERIPAGQIDRYAEFDTELFGVGPGAATIIDPQHRVLTELTWQALEDAGIDTGRHPGKVGVFVGCGPDAYLRDRVLHGDEHLRAHGHEQIVLGNARDFLAAMLSYRLGFTGPSLTVQTACSTSLVAVHQAVRSLLTYDCDIAIAGGVTVHPPSDPSYVHLPGGIYAPDGRCRSFTETAQGTVPSSGAGVVVLCRSADVGGGRRARAHVVGSSVNNDGADRMGPTAPSPRGQAEVIRDALEVAGVDPGQVGYVETHGTATRLGDQVELAALNEVYGSAAGGPCVLGAVKANIGHTDSAAGVVGFIKTVLTLENATIPPTPAQPGDGPDVALGSGRFVLSRDNRRWAGPGRYAAVSSFGLGGTNAHIVLTADADADPEAGGEAVTGGGTPVITLSGAAPEAVRARAGELATWLRAHPHHPAEVAATLWSGRRHLPYRWAAAVRPEGLLPALERAAGPRSAARRAVADPALAVLLPGQGVPLTGAGARLAAADPRYAADITELRTAVTAAGGPDLTGAETWAGDDPRLLDTAVVQPLLFTLGLAALRLLERRGVVPKLLFGHSAAEITAATYAGVFDVAGGAAAVVERGRLMAAQPPGALLLVGASAPDAETLAAGLSVEISGHQGPQATLLAGTPADVGLLAERCAAERVTVILVPADRAFHTSAMTEAAEEFTAFLKGRRLTAPQRDVLSNLTGSVLNADQATDPGYWGAQLRGSVRLDDALTTIAATAPAAVLHLHRGPGLSGTTRQVLRRAGLDSYTGDLLGSGRDDEVLAAADAFGQLWTAGFPVDLAGPPAAMPRLPGYPLAGRRYLIEPVPEPVGADPADDTPRPSAAGVPESAEGGAGVVERIWASAFGLASVSPEDNFFALGGTSLQAAHLVSVVNEELLVTSTLNDLYENSTLGDYLARVESLAAERDDDELLRLLAEIESER